MNATDLHAITDAARAAKEAANQAQAQALVDSFLIEAEAKARDGKAQAVVCRYYISGAEHYYTDPVSTVANPFATTEPPEVSVDVVIVLIPLLRDLGFTVVDEELHYPERRVRVSW